MRIDPASLQYRDAYQLLISLIVPRPIALVSTVAEDGVLNLAPFSFFTGICSKPPTVCFSVVRRRGEKKDTLRNIEATKEFVISVVSQHLAQGMNQSAAEYPPEVEEFAAAGLTPAASNRVRPPRVEEALASMECKLVEVREYVEMPYASSLVVGEVVEFCLSDGAYRDGVMDFAALSAIGRMGRDIYCHTSSLFEMKRPQLET